jgi:hypothetical protein
MANLVSLPNNAKIDDIMAIVQRDGAVILSDMMSYSQIVELSDELKPYIAVTNPGRESFSGFKTTRTGALAARSSRARRTILDERILSICDRVLLPNCERYQVNVTHIIRIMPGEVAQVMHRDRLSWQYLKGIEPQLNTIWAISDFTIENGATRVVPGSHAWPSERTAEPHEIAFAEMKRGSVLVYTGSVLHGGGANQTQNYRVGMNLTYCLGWLRQEENQYLSCPPEVARTFEPKLQALMGYASGGYGLGFYTPPSIEAGPEVYPIEHAVRASQARR